MIFGIRVVAACVTVALLFVGPLAPIAAAQQQPPPPPPAQSAQPDVFRESMKTGPTGSPPVSEMDTPMPSPFYDVAAGAMTATFLIPGRIVTCGLGNALAGLVLVFTFGTGYRTATRVLEEGCGGKWILRGDDLMPDRSPESMRGPLTEPR